MLILRAADECGASVRWQCASRTKEKTNTNSLHFEYPGWTIVREWRKLWNSIHRRFVARWPLILVFIRTDTLFVGRCCTIGCSEVISLARSSDPTGSTVITTHFCDLHTAWRCWLLTNVKNIVSKFLEPRSYVALVSWRGHISFPRLHSTVGPTALSWLGQWWRWDVCSYVRCVLILKPFHSLLAISCVCGPVTWCCLFRTLLAISRFWGPVT